MQTASETATTEPARLPEAMRLPPPEPATARALWPTFMRRTLSEEVVARPPASQPRQ